jgi:exosortase A-associated hydrolase 1
VRRLISFPCASETLMGSLDQAAGKAGLLIVSGGNEVRMGAHRGMAMLAARVAGAGYPVFRFDRRGIGDSTGENRGFESSADDIVAAAATFRQAAGVSYMLGFGNCDAATSLALFHREAGLDALMLANPWTIDDADALPPAGAIRARYAKKLRDPREWIRLARGGVDIGKLIKGLTKLRNSSSPTANGLAGRMAQALANSPASVSLLLAERDNTAIAFREHWDGDTFGDLHVSVPLVTCPTDSHSFASAADKEWLFAQLISALQLGSSSR